MRRSGTETLVLRGSRPGWARWAARLARACFCVLGGLFFWWLLGGVAQAQAEPASLTDQATSIVDTVVDDLAQPPSTGVEPVDSVTSTVGNVIRGVERSLPPLTPRSEPPVPLQTPAPAEVSTQSPAPPSPPPARSTSTKPADTTVSSASAAESTVVSTEADLTPGAPTLPMPQSPFAGSSPCSQLLDARPPGAPPPTNQHQLQALPSDEDLADVRVTRPDVFPD